MQRILCLILTLLCSFSTFVNTLAQCGVKDSYDSTFTIEKRALALKSTNKRAKVANIAYPIWAHILADDAGENSITLEEIEEDLKLVNTHFQDVGVSFYICNSEIILNDDYNSITSEEEQKIIASTYNRSNVINIYFAKKLHDGNCGLSVYPWSDGERIFMDIDCMGGNSTTLSHELGHYFGLPHTHAAVGGGELVDGSNCASAGDRICDTPADPTLSGLVNSDCEYEGTATDANGDFYNPDVHNLMSYSQKKCRTYFSPEQIAVMKYYIENERNYYGCTDGVLPDLFTRITYVPAKFTQGYGSYVYVYHYYSGNQELTSVPKLAFYLSTDKELDEEDLFLSEYESTILSPDVFSERELGWIVVPENYPSGVYYLICVADHDNVVAENFEDNNTTYGMISVGCSQTEILDPIIRTTNPSCENIDGTITFSNLSENTTYKFSLDGGLTYTAQTSDAAGTYTIENLEADTFNVFITYNNECAVNLGKEVLEQSTCNLDCNGDIDGTASFDDCNICSGGATGIPENTCPTCLEPWASAEDGENIAGNVLDDELETRWSANGVGEYIELCVGADPLLLDKIQVAFYNGDVRTTSFDLQTTVDGINWTTVLTNAVSSGNTLELETFTFDPTEVWKIRVVGLGNSINNWNSITEIKWENLVTATPQVRTKSFSIYPNPTTGIVNLSQSTNYKIFNTLGQLILSGEGKQVDLSAQNKGVYSLRVGFQSFKIVKQ